MNSVETEMETRLSCLCDLEEALPYNSTSIEGELLDALAVCLASTSNATRMQFLHLESDD